LISLLVVLSATLCSNPVRGADYTKVGVTLGATADYSLSETGSTANRMHVYVYGIVGSQVTLNITKYYPNGTIASQLQFIVDLVAGGLYFNWLISGNLAPTDAIYSGASYVISDAPTRQVAGASRPQNHVVDTNYWGSGNRVDFYWDQATGLATNMTVWFLGWTNFTLMSTSLWSGLPLVPILLAGGAIVLIIAAIAIVVKRRK
jgi:hypothetical protein